MRIWYSIHPHLYSGNRVWLRSHAPSVLRGKILFNPWDKNHEACIALGAPI